MTIRVIALLGIGLILGCNPEPSGHPDDQGTDTTSPIGLTQMSPDETGIHFNNALVDTGNLNIFIWNFLYTGAGVATGDINNDGMPDIYFAGNQVGDRLYLNQGDFKFEDITTRAGIQQDRSWTTGVTMADVNADGFLDIYVCKNSPTPNRNANRNRLYINNGNNTFSESAAEYGLADEGFSIQATFFDPDQDGDLDMFLANQPFDQLARFIHPQETVHEYPVTDRFFENIDGHFIDKTMEMGMEDDRYGLGISLGDYDGNGWTDIYECNDYAQADRLYMNNHGRFTDEINTLTGHISFYSMGSDAGDVNNDGWEDVFVLDMAFEDYYRAKTNMESMQPEVFWDIVAHGHQYPYAQNTMQLNRGDGHFSEVAQIGGLSKTDWSWAALLADLDQDGWQDILVTNGILRDMKNNDFAQWIRQQYQGRVGPENYREVLTRLPSNPVANKIYRNLDGMRYDDVSNLVEFGGPGFSHGLAYADFDGDGALDLVVNNMNAPAGIFRNTSHSPGHYFILSLEGPEKNVNGLGIPVVLYADGMSSARTMQTTRGYYSSCVPSLHFGLGSRTIIDSVIIYWNATEMSVIRSVPANTRKLVTYAEAEKVPRRIRTSTDLNLTFAGQLPFTHNERPFDDYKDQVLLPYKLSQNGPFITHGNVDGNAGDEIFIGGASGQPGMILRRAAKGEWMPMQQPALEADALYEDMQGIFFDADHDGDIDLYVVSGSNEFAEGDPLLEDRLYRNDGSGAFSRDMHALPDGLRINGQCAVPIDINNDDYPDLFVAGRLVSGQYPRPANSAMLINDHHGTFTDQTLELAPELKELGMITDVISDDIDGDGDVDLFVVGEWMSPTILRNDQGKLTAVPLDDPGQGLWWSIAKGDIDKDGDNDFVLGNLGWNQKFGGVHPKLEVYSADFDQSGDNDVVLAKTVGGKELPYRGRECSSEEMPFIASKFPTYDAFANARLDEILGKDKLQRSLHRKVSTLSTVWLRNDGDLRFAVAELPMTVQTGPVKAMYIDDFNGDGNVDILYCGNHFPVEVETARYDALMQGICFGDGKGGFRPRVFSSSTPLTGDYRDVCVLKENDGGFTVILVQNDGPALSYRLITGQN